MELRDEIACNVLPSIYERFWKDIDNGMPLDDKWRHGLALDAYMLADAMIKMRDYNKDASEE